MNLDASRIAIIIQFSTNTRARARGPIHRPFGPIRFSLMCLTSQGETVVILFESYYYLSSSVAYFKVSKSVSGLIQFKRPVDDRCHPSELQEVRQNGHVLFVECCDVGNELFAHES